MNYPLFSNEHTSLMSKYLNEEIFNKLKDKKTTNNFTLEQAINSGLKNPDSGIGVYAGDEETYTVFKKLLDPIIKEYHHFKKKEIHISDLDINNLNAPYAKEEDNYIVSTRIRLARNLKDFPLGPGITDEQREIIEQTISSALTHLKDDLKGKYYALDDLSQEDRDILVKNHFLFKQGDRFLQAAGLNNNWPKNRGIYHNIDKTFLVWINEEDQLRIISMQQGGNIKEVFERLIKAIKQLEKTMQFSHTEHLGYITSCPTNLGTAMRASVHIKLPKLGLKMDDFNEICDKYYLQIRGVDGEHSSSDNGVYDISNKRRLGITEVQCVQDMYDGVQALIKKEKSL